MPSRLTSRPMPSEEKPVDVPEDVAKAKDATRLAELTVVFFDYTMGQNKKNTE